MKLIEKINIEALFLIIIILPFLYYNIPTSILSDQIWYLGNALILWLLTLLVRYLLGFIHTSQSRWYSYSVVLTTLSLINLLDELFGHPEKHEPSEYIMGTGVIVYEIIQYFRRKKLNSNA